MTRSGCLGLLASTLLAAPSTFAEDRSAFTWKDGDRVVLIGDTLIERDLTQGYLETLITANNPVKTSTFR
ncbi:MAG: GDSL family lipase, partial [Isosphaeraceae bacterium]